MNKDQKQFLAQLILPASMALLILLIHISVSLFEIKYLYGGVFPRKIEGLWGIFFSPLLHSGWSHLFSNIIPIFLLSSAIVVFYPQIARSTIAIIWIMTGLMVWLFGRENTYHVGASGVVYGMIAFIFALGLFRGSRKSIILALTVLILYGGFFEGLVPKEGISWESHLYGALIGMITAFIFKNVHEKDEIDQTTSSIQTKHLFFAPDTFTETKIQRAERIAYLQELQRIAALEAERLRNSTSEFN